MYSFMKKSFGGRLCSACCSSAKSAKLTVFSEMIARHK